MYDFLKSGDKMALGAHGGVGKFGVTYDFADNQKSSISFDALDKKFTSLIEDYMLYIDACGAEENFEYLKAEGLAPKNLKAAPGASGEANVPSNAAKALGVNADAWGEKK